jgi:uncharacterized membrane protein
MPTTYRLLHSILAFAWFAAVFAAHWNVMQSRRAAGWRERAALFASNRALSTFVSLPALLGVGILGNLLGMQLGYSMKDTMLFRVSNGLWVALVLVALFIEMPASGALGALSHAAADAETRGGSGEPAGWSRELARWRMGNGIQLLLWLVLLIVMTLAPWGASH